MAPVICQLITRLSTARLCEERDDKTEDASSVFPEFVFPSSGRTQKLESAGLRQNQGLQRLGGTGQMTQSQPLPFPETRPFPLDTSSQAFFPKPPAWPLVKETRDRWLLRDPGDR